MSFASAKTAFAAGEVSPALWARTDLSKFALGCATLRNCFVSVRGGAYSRPGTKYVGQAKQAAAAASTPPRIIPFQFSVGQGYIIELGDGYARFIVNGAYITETPRAVTNATQANPCVLTVPGHAFANGDAVFVANVGGMTAINSLTFLVADSNTGAGTFSLHDTFGNPVNSLAFTAYTSGGTVARIYTVAMPYAASDLPYLKWTQSADVMSLALVNLPALTEYVPADLSRLAAASWTLAATSFASAIAAPAACSAGPTTLISALASPNNQPAANYAYCVTAVNAAGQESVASPVAYTPVSPNAGVSVDIAITAGSVIVTWSTVAGAVSYNVYKAPASVWNTGSGGANPGTAVPIGASFGFAGRAFGNQWVDQNVVADASTTPPLHQNPFARGQIVGVTMLTVGAAYVQLSTGVSITSSTGTGAVIVPVVVNGQVVACIVLNAGQNYKAGDTITFTDPGGGSGATATLSIGPQSGTYPGAVAYFQQRRSYAQSLNNPDTYWLSQPGAYTNMDAADPPVADDAVTGTPWAQQVNGVQWLVPMTSGLLIGTGLDAWLLTGSGGAGTPVAPASQSAAAQEANGFSATVPPIKINYEVIYLQALGNVVRAATYNFLNNTYTSNDLTVMANHLFDGRSIVQWAWAREPYKLLWAVRDDGVLLSLTYLKEQDVIAWARHDTNGQVVSIAVATEPPVDAVYIVVKRYIAGKAAYGYFVERLDNRLWLNAEQAWCVDAGLALALPTPAATLTPAAASGTGVLFSASAAVFDGVATGVAGQIIRVGGGKATVAAYISPTQVSADITLALTALTPNDPNNLPLPQPAGAWSIATPVSSVTGIPHLEGMMVTGLADGAVIPPTVCVNGSIALPNSATAVVVGLGFQAQLQSLPLDLPGQPTVAGKRKKISAVTVRLEKSRGVKLGTDQLNASELENYATAPWGVRPYGKMIEIKEPQAQLAAGGYLPLFTGDHRIPVDGDWNRPGWSGAPGMVAAQQDYPLPMNILGFVPETTVGDSHTKGDPP